MLDSGFYAQTDEKGVGGASRSPGRLVFHLGWCPRLRGASVQASLEGRQSSAELTVEVASGLSENASGRRRRLPLNPFFSSVRGRPLIAILLGFSRNSGDPSSVLVAAIERNYAQERVEENARSHAVFVQFVAQTVKHLGLRCPAASPAIMRSPPLSPSFETRMTPWHGPHWNRPFRITAPAIGIASFVRLISSDGQTLVDTLAPRFPKLSIDEEMIVRAEDSPSLQATKIEALGESLHPRDDLSAACARAERLDWRWFSAGSRLGRGVQSSEQLRDRVPLRWQVSSASTAALEHADLISLPGGGNTPAPSKP